MNADALGKLYRFLQMKDENRKFKKSISKNQITLDDAIRRAEKQKRTGAKKHGK
nr:MAG TPA: hypothetical protein [Microviridae sp.]